MWPEPIHPAVRLWQTKLCAQRMITNLGLNMVTSKSFLEARWIGQWLWKTFFYSDVYRVSTHPLRNLAIEPELQYCGSRGPIYPVTLRNGKKMLITLTSPRTVTITEKKKISGHDDTMTPWTQQQSTLLIGTDNSFIANPQGLVQASQHLKVGLFL